jgi:hypothetical protein
VALIRPDVTVAADTQRRAKMRRLLATVTVLGVVAAIGPLVASTALAAPRLLQVSPKQVNFGNLAGSTCIAAWRR